jgi:hypothetical protein
VPLSHSYIYICPMSFCYFLEIHINRTIYCIAFYIWLLSLSTIFLDWFMLFCGSVFVSFKFLSRILLYGNKAKYSIPCCHQLAYFQFGAMTNKSAVNIWYWSLYIGFVYFSRCLEVGLLSLMCWVYMKLEVTDKLSFSKVAVPLCILINKINSISMFHLLHIITRYP